MMPSASVLLLRSPKDELCRAQPIQLQHRIRAAKDRCASSSADGAIELIGPDGWILIEKKTRYLMMWMIQKLY